MRAPLAAFDLDGTLNLLPYDLVHALERHGITTTVEALWSDSWRSLLTRTSLTSLRVVIEEHLLQRASPDAAAVACARRLVADGWCVEVWTARAWHPYGLAVTQTWLDRMGLGGARVRLTVPGRSKTRCVAQHAPPDLYIDDAARQVRALRAGGVSAAWLIDRPWNRVEQDVPRCATVAEAMAASVADLAFTPRARSHHRSSAHHRPSIPA
ncbi:MAG TPA: hypothetical protein VFQ88_12400 [Nevskiaceae bacterium]|nr:hypothetical protein [Nevskiaceae bacterium]